MNRKLFFGLLVSACMLFVTSCKKDELDESHYGGETKVTFSLGLEGENVATKSISDGEKVDKLIYAVFKENGERIPLEAEETVTFPDTVTLILPKGQTYKVAFWAQDSDCQAYTVNKETMNVTVSYVDALNNDETRDAFFAAQTVLVGHNQTIDVTMKRPFAQLNVGATQEAWNRAVALGVEILESKVVISEVANSINLLTGEVSGSQVVEYNFDTIPAKFINNAEDLRVGDTDYKWLSMSYILVNGETVINNILLTLSPKSGNDFTFDISSIPVQRNWRTNLLGNLLTHDITFNISIDKNYNNDYNPPL